MTTTAATARHTKTDAAGVLTLDLVLRLMDRGATRDEAVARVAAESGATVETVDAMTARGLLVVAAAQRCEQ